MVQFKFAALAALFVKGALAAPSLFPPALNLSSDHDNLLSKRATSYWYSNIDHFTGEVRGYAPDLDGDHVYEVFKAVNAGEGAAIQAAINSATNGATRHGKWFASQPRVSRCPGMTMKCRHPPANVSLQVVYLPPGTYTVSRTILMNTDTILMGDATNVRPFLLSVYETVSQIAIMADGNGMHVAPNHQSRRQL